MQPQENEQRHIVNGAGLSYAHVALLKIDYHNRFPIAFVGLAANKQMVPHSVVYEEVAGSGV